MPPSRLQKGTGPGLPNDDMLTQAAPSPASEVRAQRSDKMMLQG